jgi:hypothetical protein
MRQVTRGFIMSLAFAGFVTSASAQDANAQDPRGPLKLDAPSKAVILAVLDSARAQGLAVKPLEDRMKEGIAKGVEGPRIAASVRQLFFDMVTVQRALGPVASSDELKAAAYAMHAGVPPVELGKLKKQSRLRSLVTPFTVTADLISRGVPVTTAINAVKSLVGAGAKDKEINDFQRNVKEDIQQGAPPAAAAETRAKGATSNGKPETKETKPEQQIDSLP